MLTRGTLYVLALGLAACGRIGFDAGLGVTSGSGEADAAGDGASGSDDSGSTTARCATWSPFSPPVSLVALNTVDIDWAPTVSDDELTIVFSSERSGGGNARKLYTASRTDASMPFGTPTLLASTEIAGQEDNATLSGDGLMVAFDRAAGSSPTLTFTTRSALTDSFANPPTDIVLSAVPAPPAGASLSSDGLALTVTYQGAIGVGFATRPTTQDPFVFQGDLPVPDTGSDESWPWLSDDRLELFFTSNSKIMWARRTDAASPFAAASPITELDETTTNESDPELSKDGRTIYFSSARSGNWDLWMATRTCLD